MYWTVSFPLQPCHPLHVFPPRSLDVSEARACPGVVDVITAEDVPGDNNHSGEIFYAQSEVCDLYAVCYLTPCSNVKTIACGYNLRNFIH